MSDIRQIGFFAAAASMAAEIQLWEEVISREKRAVKEGSGCSCWAGLRTAGL